MSLVVELPLALLDEAADNVRQQRESAGSLDALSESIPTHGILVPLIVTPHAGRYLIVAGHRRSRAARAAGLDTVPVTVRTLDEQTRLEVMLAENAGRRSLDPFDEAAAYRKLVVKSGLTQAEVAARCGVSIAHVSNRILLLGLDAADRRRVRKGSLSIAGAIQKARGERQAAGGRTSNGGRPPVARPTLELVPLRYAIYRSLCRASTFANVDRNLLKSIADTAARDALRYIQETAA